MLLFTIMCGLDKGYDTDGCMVWYGSGAALGPGRVVTVERWRLWRCGEDDKLTDTKMHLVDGRRL